MSDVQSPSSIFQARGCSAKVLSLSDQHAAILLSVPTDNDERREEKSLLNLTIVPSHREVLSPNRNCDNPEEVSKTIVSFLQGHVFQLTSESGAEYSYYDAEPKRDIFGGFVTTVQSFMFGSFASAGPKRSPAFKVELISPASDRQIQRATPAPGLTLIEETPTMYDAVARPFIQSIVDTGSLSWVQNIVDGTKETERLLLNKEEYVLNVDTKWRSHPDANVIPREEWFDHNAIVDLYCLAIAKDSEIHSLRDLRRKHLPMLRSMMKDATVAIEDIYGVARDQLRVFVHYHPQFYHFHVHFTRLENQIGCQVERGHLLSDIVQNLELDDLFYSKRTIAFKLPSTDKMCQKIDEWRSNSSKGE